MSEASAVAVLPSTVVNNAMSASVVIAILLHRYLDRERRQRP
jgi:hypothetical protein